MAKAVEAARRVCSIDPNAYGVLIGRVRELMCRDQKAAGKTLSDQLNDLASKGMIPSGLVSITKLLRQYRNVAVHARLGALSPAEVPVLDQLTRATLEYVYSAPALAEKALKRLENLQREASEPAEEDKGLAPIAPHLFTTSSPQPVTIALVEFSRATASTVGRCPIDCIHSIQNRISKEPTDTISVHNRN